MRGADHREEAMRAVAEMAGAEAESVHVEKISGAWSNHVFIAAVTQGDARQEFVVKIFGSGGTSGGEDEAAIAEAMSLSGQGPRILSVFNRGEGRPSGRVEEYIRGETFSAGSFRSSWGAMAGQLAAFYALLSQQKIRPRMTVWRRMALSMQQAAECAEQDFLKRKAPDLKDTIARLAPVCLSLEADFKRRYMDIPDVVCHCDAHMANWITCAGHESERSTALRLIDYEYAAVGPCVYDLSNFWVECGYDYNAGGGVGHLLDPSRMPDESERRQHAELFLDALRRKGIVLPHSPAMFAQAAEVLLALSHLTWAAWATKMAAERGDDAEFEYCAFAIDRFRNAERLPPVQLWLRSNH